MCFLSTSLRRRDYDLIRRECASLRTEVGSERRACARQRLGVMVSPEHVVHRVTPVTRGERSIVKFVYTTTLDKTDEFYDNLTTYER